MLGLMKYILCDKDEADILMMTVFRKQIAHTSNGLCVVPQVIQYELTRLIPLVFKIHWNAFVIKDVQI